MRKSFLLEHLRRAAGRRIFRIRLGVWAFLAMACSPLAAQNTLRPEDLTLESIVPPTGSTNRLSVQFMLPLPDTVSSFEVSASGMPIDKDKLNFTPAAKIQDFRCAVLLLIDNALGNNPDLNKSAHEKLPDVQESVRGALRRLFPAAANGPFEFGIATYSATNMVVLAAIKGNNASVLDQAVLPKYLKFDGGDPELLYHGAKEAIVKSLGTIQADRKFLVIISDGVSKDTADSEADVVKAAHDAKVHICTIGFPKTPPEADQIERLARLAEQTGGLAWTAEGHYLNLPPGWDSNLLTFMISGGRGEVNLAGRTAPVKLEFKVKTNADRVFVFNYTVESMPSQLPSLTPSPATSPAATQAATPPPSLSAPSAAATQAATPPPSLSAPSAAFPISTPASFWGWVPAGLKAYPPLMIGVGAALLLVLILVLALVVRAVRKPKPDPVEDTTMVSSEPPPPLTEVTSVPERVAPVLAWLVSLDAHSTRHPITKTAVRIGRKQDNDLVMKNDSVSSHHAEILKRGDKFIIADLGASNGVFVSGKRVEKIALENGDIIELGEVRLRFMLNQSDE
jgi:hypothetical protein